MENDFLSSLAKSAMLCFDYKLNEGMLSRFHEIGCLLHPAMRKFPGLKISDGEKSRVKRINLFYLF